jgi:hypothetical protein
MFCSDYPRGVINSLWLRYVPAFDTVSIALALAVALPFARRRRPVSLLRLPPRPFPGCLTARCATVALARVPEMKTLFASFQQTPSHPRPVRPPLPAAFLISSAICRIAARPRGGGESGSNARCRFRFRVDMRHVSRILFDRSRT